MWAVGACLLMLAVGAQPVQQIISTGLFLHNLSSPLSSENLYCSGFTSYNGFWFSNVSVHRGAVIQSALLTLNLKTSLSVQYSIESADNSSALTSCSNFLDRDAFPTNTTSASSGRQTFNVTAHTSMLINRAGWKYGNAMAAVIILGFNLGGSQLNQDAVLLINYTVASNVTLSRSTSIVPMAGNWSSGLNVAATNTNISVSIPTVSFVPSFSAVPISVNLTGSISNNVTTVPCVTSVAIINSPNTTIPFVCPLSCAPGKNYQLILRYCWSVPSAPQVLGKLTFTHRLNGTGCWNETITGTINFPNVAFLSGTLLPDDGRAYPPGAGQLNSNASFQPLSSRDLFSALVGVQHFCPGPWVSLWLTSNLTQVPCTVQTGRLVTPPPDAADDYSTLQFVVPACNQATCPGENPMVLKMTYANLTLNTSDILVDTFLFLFFPLCFGGRGQILILSWLSGTPRFLWYWRCRDVWMFIRPRHNAPRSEELELAFTWRNLLDTLGLFSSFFSPLKHKLHISLSLTHTHTHTLSLSLSLFFLLSFFYCINSCSEQVSVLVVGPCTSVTTNSSIIYCTLPSGAGTNQPLFVFSAGLVSTAVAYVSYSPPVITNLTGGVGCVDDFIEEQDNSAAVSMCDRNGSTSVLMTIIGSNFGAANVQPILTLQKTAIPVIKSSTSPHTTLYFYLPAGTGAMNRLTLSVASQETSAYVSYEPCLLGEDASCTPCTAGR